MAAGPWARAPRRGFHVHYPNGLPATHEVSSIITFVLHPEEDTGEVTAKPTESPGPQIMSRTLGGSG